VSTASLFEEFGSNCLFPVFYLKFNFGHYNRHNKRPLGRSRPGCENNIKVGLQEVGFGGMGWIELAQGSYR
jgi:hypothetical protein